MPSIITKLPPQDVRPLWSVMIPTYNYSTFLEAALLSVIEQDPGPAQMQIELVDDCSNGDPALDTLRELGLLDRVQYYKQPRNLGLAGNWNTCIERAKGEVVHILHQDDIVLPGFYTVLGKAFLDNPEIGAAFCRHHVINDLGNIVSSPAFDQVDSGISPDWLRRIAFKQLIQTPAIAVRKSTYEVVGGFSKDLFYTLDWEMWLRISSNFPVWYVSQVLAEYRVHLQSETTRLVNEGENIRDIRKFYQIRKKYLPRAISEATENSSKKYHAKLAFDQAIQQLDRRNWRGGFRLIFEGLLLKADYDSICRLFLNIRRFLKKGRLKIIDNEISPKKF